MQMTNPFEEHGIALPQLVGQRIQHSFRSYGLGTIKKAYIAEDMRVYVEIKFDTRPKQTTFSLSDMLGEKLFFDSETIDGVPVSALICRAKKRMQEKLEEEKKKRQAAEKEKYEEEQRKQAKEKEEEKERRKKEAERQKKEERRRQSLERLEKWKKEQRRLKEAEQRERKERQKIYNYFTKERGVTSFIHFTPEENLSSILQHGIVSRDTLSSLQFDAVVPDQDRIDNCLSYSSLSVSFPNYRVMYKKRRYQNLRFVLLCIDPQIILDLSLSDISYLPTNAANQSLPQKIEEYIGFSAAEGIFSETAYNHKTGASCQRSELNIPDNFSTDPQAEVFVRATIKPGYIQEIICEDNIHGQQILDVLCEHGLQNPWTEKTFYCEGLFDKRSDYKFWKSAQ